MIKYSNNLISFFNLNSPLVFAAHYILLFTIILSLNHLEKFQDLNLVYQDYLSSQVYKKQTAHDKQNNFTKIAIDDRSFHHLAQSFGSTRISVAKIIHELRKHDPKLIIVNFLFYGKGLSVEDIYLTAAANADLPIYFKAKLTKKGEFFTPIEAYSAITPNFGFLDLIEDTDEVIRKVRTTASYPHTGTLHDLTSQITREISGNEDSSYLTKNSLFTICYSLTDNDIKTITAEKLITKNFNKRDIKDKIIIVDGTASVYQNTFSTPIGNMSEGTIIANAIRSQTMPDKKYTAPSQTKSFLALLLITLFFFLLTLHGSLPWTILWNSFGLLGMIIISSKAFDVGNILPYTSLITAILLPGIYNWIIRYLNLTIQSRNLVRMASIDSLTNLYSFRYFCFLLQRSFVRNKKKKTVLYVAAIDILPASYETLETDTPIPQSFYNALGKIINNALPSRSITGFLSDKKRCFMAFRKRKNESPLILLENIRNEIQKLIDEKNLKLTLKAAGVDMEIAHSHSSFQLIQILDNMLMKKTSENKIIEFEPSALTVSIPDSGDNNLPDTDLSYVSLQIKEDQKDLEIMKKKLSYSIQEYTMAQKMSAMGKLSSYYAHELKNPLHNLLNCFEIIEDPEEDQECKEETIQMMKSEIQRVVELTKKMGSHFKPSDEKPSETNINNLINHTLSFLNRKFKEHEIQVISEFDETIPSLFIVEDQIKQVFLNLFLNAIDAMQDGGYLIIATFLAPPIVRITVSDTGSGIGENDLERIFDVFYTTKQKEGTGIGLFACYNIIQQHGGSIKVQSTEQEGTCFEIILPL